MPIVKVNNKANIVGGKAKKKAPPGIEKGAGLYVKERAESSPLTSQFFEKPPRPNSFGLAK